MPSQLSVLAVRSLCAIAALLCASQSAAALDLAGRDTSVAACTDFYAHMNGAWEKRTEIPADRARIGSFDTLRVANYILLENALDELLAKPELQRSPGLKLAAAAYASAIDAKQIEANGLTALAPLFKRIDDLSDRGQLGALMGELARVQVSTGLDFSVSPDSKDVRRHALYMTQSGLGLPARDDYTRADSARLRAAYRLHAAELLKQAGFASGAADIDALMSFEAALAEAHMTPVERRDPNATYNALSVAALAQRAAGFDWAAYLSGYLGTQLKAKLIVSQPKVADRLARLAREASLADWQRYLRVRLLDAYAPRLPAAYASSHNAFHQKAVRGLASEVARGERVILDLGGGTGNQPLGAALGEVFVSRAFSPRAQARANAMIEDIREAMRSRIAGLTWMSPQTKPAALEKLNAMQALIGGPAAAKDYSGLVLSAADYAGNALRIYAWEAAERARRLNEPVDRSRWDTSPFVVNAFAGGLNRIVFPAGILQPPFFDENADDAVNFGGIGMVIGHEITHHFDDRGRQYDAAGQLRDWWTAADADAYRARANRVVSLYGSYEPLPKEFINGAQMLGENISDLGGIHIAYAGLQIALKRQGDGAQKPINGLTPEQRFFASNAIVWRGKQRAQALLNQLRTGQHSPGQFRVIGPMSNMPEFAQAYACKAGDPMRAADPILVW